MTHGFTRVMVALCLLLAGCAPAAPAERTRTSPAPSTGGDARMFAVTSQAFSDGGRIPARHAATGVAGGENISPPLDWTGAPPDTRSFAIATVDHHPVARMWVHWLVVDVPATATGVPDAASGTVAMPGGCRELDNTGGTPGWGGPRPPVGTGDHDYVTTVYALDVGRLDLPDRASLPAFEGALEGHVLARASVTGLFRR